MINQNFFKHGLILLLKSKELDNVELGLNQVVELYRNSQINDNRIKELLLEISGRNDIYTNRLSELATSIYYGA